MQAYCMKCRTKREIRRPMVVRLKNGRPATKGICPVCGTELYRICKEMTSEPDFDMRSKEIQPGPDFTIRKRR